MGSSYTYQVETYAFFRNLDESILLLNEFIKVYGYRFVVLSIEELEENFSDLFGLSKGFNKGNTIVGFEGLHGLSISKVFSDAISNSNIDYFYIARNQYKVVALTRTEYTVVDVNNFKEDHSTSHKLGGELQKFVHSLLTQLRLFKNGDVKYTTVFQITLESRKILTRLEAGPSSQMGFENFSITVDESKILGNDIVKELNVNELSSLALEHFELSYNIADPRVKFITLMTCLESLFNVGRDQIAHSISRHLSLIVSNSESEFNEHYKKIKELYNLRSALIHGTQGQNKQLNTNLALLYEYSRMAVNYCLKQEINKVALFNSLNTSGINLKPLNRK